MFSSLEVLTKVMVCEIDMLITHQTSDTLINIAETFDNLLLFVKRLEIGEVVCLSHFCNTFYY